MKPQKTDKKPRTRATSDKAPTFETAKEILKEGAELYEELKNEMLDNTTAKSRGYILQICGALYRNIELERRIDDVEKKLISMESKS